MCPPQTVELKWRIRKAHDSRLKFHREEVLIVLRIEGRLECADIVKQMQVIIRQLQHPHNRFNVPRLSHVAILVLFVRSTFFTLALCLSILSGAFLYAHLI